MYARTHIRALGLAVGAATAVAIFAGGAAAAEYPPPPGTTPEQTLSDSTPEPGESLTVTIPPGTMEANEPGQTNLLSTPVLLATWKADATGAVQVSVTIPLNTEKCLHHIVSTGDRSGRSVSSPVAVGGVTAACASEAGGGSDGGSLPKTGAQVLGLGLLGAALVGGGITLRRRAKANV